MDPMSATTSRIYNSTDGPLIIDAEGHVLAARESTRVKSVADEPIVGHLEAGRLIDTTEAKAEGAEAEDVLDDQLVQAQAVDVKTKATKATTTSTRS
jgi:hypothetical protein